MVSMPFQLTPELIEAVKTDPSTSFEDKADGHHAIGWLIDAWAVLVRKANANRGPSISPREAGYVDLTSVTVLGALLLIVLGSIGLMVYGIEANKAEWEKFKVDNNCKVTSKVSGDLFNTVGFDAKGGVVVGVGATPDKTGWLCSDGVTYFR